MTICIAAACRDGEGKKIVLCTDNRLSSALGSTDQGKKDKLLPHRWRCLWSGDEPEFLPLLRLYEEQFKYAQDLQATTIDASMQTPLVKRKRQLTDEYVQGRFSLSYDEFLKSGKERLPPDIFHDAVRNISDISLRVELIIAGFIDDDAEIYSTDRAGKARPANDFAIIGEGEYLAHSVLLRRQQHAHDTLERTIYNLYEAKRFSEAVGSVGATTHIRILAPGKKSKLTSYNVDNQLRALYDSFGPKEVPSALKFEGEYYYKQEDETGADGEADNSAA